jgi:hypothetical protein
MISQKNKFDNWAKISYNRALGLKREKNKGMEN